MVDAAKLRRAQEKAGPPSLYRQLQEVVARLVAMAAQAKHPLLERHDPIKKVTYVVITDRGLCGAFNTNIIRRAIMLLVRMEAGGSGIGSAGKVVTFTASGDITSRRFHQPG